MFYVQVPLFTYLIALLLKSNRKGKIVLLFILSSPIPSNSPPAEVGTSVLISLPFNWF